jgi:cholesterol transport system auxiliary component
MRAVRPLLPAAAALALTACFGGKTPATLLTLTPAAPPAANTQRSVAAGEAVVIEVPVVAKELRQVRVPVLEAPGRVTYVRDLQYVDTPDRLFQQLLSETVRRTTSRAVLDPRQTAVEPGVQLTGTLQRFGYDVASGQVIVTFDAAAARPGANRLELRRFEASAPSDGTAASVGPALNQAANAVAVQVAGWVAR